ncbi:MAG: hypothetical protein QW753_07635 [Thermofilum sp.]
MWSTAPRRPSLLLQRPITGVPTGGLTPPEKLCPLVGLLSDYAGVNYRLESHRREEGYCVIEFERTEGSSQRGRREAAPALRQLVLDSLQLSSKPCPSPEAFSQK